jgi:uncharacterized protein (TIGR03435 family)
MLISTKKFRGLTVVMCSLSVLSWPLPALAQQAPQNVDSKASQSNSGPSAAYDVVSIKPHKADNVGSWWRTTPSGFSANVPVRSLIMSAFHLVMFDQLSGLPPWAENENFDVEAKLDPDNADAFQKLPKEDKNRQYDLMLQSLLADRFKLAVRREQKQLPVYNLVVAKGGSKMKEAPASEKGSGYSVGMGRLAGKAASIQSLAFSLSNQVGRLIIDKTGLAGKYDMNLTWAWNDQPGSADAGPSIFTALQDQLGLKLEPAKAPVDVVGVDHLERPSEN